MNTLVSQSYLRPSAQGNFQQYLTYIQSIPLLSAEEEKSLITRYSQENDVLVVKTLILSHLRFVYTVAKGYTGYGLPIEDMVQEGNIGLMKAVKKFDLSFGCRLATYAVHFIKAEIQEYIFNNWKLVKVATTKAKRKLFFNLRKRKRSTNWLTYKEASAVANELNVSVENVKEMEARLHLNDHYLGACSADESVDSVSTSKSATLALEDRRFAPASNIEVEDLSDKQQRGLRTALSSLDARSQEIIRRRFLVDSAQQATLQELAQDFNISQERVRQIEVKALQKLKTALAEDSLFTAF
ncbi:RNA polymerase sigma factor RpoH [Alteromonas sp. ASW11-130]|uniref:RNA polymerase sigma factor RpoH n=1 Tax=Alteromonas sp. ASW11-130 TaxID=3015775 RepID=UPI002241930C|nr:RNA polymerase sigma factor RpoH [Alteromonas sp. ASW11-130]MCW8092342.1 RNA polymerase sigma factor RpoH [Alteromonas sp. ASW11-130]